MTIMYNTAIIDADFAIKVGRFEQLKVIEEVIPLLIGKLYIHQWVYDNEILLPPIVKKQIDVLIAKGKAEIVDRLYLENIDPFKGIIYDSTISLLENEIENTVREHKNWGEVVSIAFAKAFEIKIFFSDETELQDIINEHVNIGDTNNYNSNDIKVIRIKDFIFWLKERGFSRKKAKQIWVVSKQPEESLEKLFLIMKYGLSK